jgi:hypothetical protein
VFAYGFYREGAAGQAIASTPRQAALRVAEKLEKLFAGREMDVSSELALHFEAAAERARAAQALCTAAGTAMRRGARDEGLKLTERALRLLENWSEPERQAAEKDSPADCGSDEALTTCFTPDCFIQTSPKDEKYPDSLLKRTRQQELDKN